MTKRNLLRVFVIGFVLSAGLHSQAPAQPNAVNVNLSA